MAPLSSPCPDNRQFMIKAMKDISFSKLIQGDESERARLLEAAEDDGFFYLDLSGEESQGLWKTYEDCLAVMAAWFDKPLEEKAKFAYNSDIHGYKHLGSQAGPVENSRDGFETLRISPDNVAASGTAQPMPAAIIDNAPLVTDLIRTSRHHIHVLLSEFSNAHGLSGPARYEAFHDDSAPSDSSLSFHRYPQCSTIPDANIGHNKHTDAGTLTILFTSQWGLQVQSSAEDDEWEWVRPRPGYAICNIGDSLRFMSGTSLRSVVHRVVPTADQMNGHRYCVGWFCRPAYGTMFQDSEGRMIRSDEWLAQKFNVMRGSHEDQRNNSVLTGGMETLAQRTKIGG